MRATNPKTGDVIEWDGKTWKSVGNVNAPPGTTVGGSYQSQSAPSFNLPETGSTAVIDPVGPPTTLIDPVGPALADAGPAALMQQFPDIPYQRDFGPADPQGVQAKKPVEPDYSIGFFESAEEEVTGPLKGVQYVPMMGGAFGAAQNVIYLDAARRLREGYDYTQPISPEMMVPGAAGTKPALYTTQQDDQKLITDLLLKTQEVHERGYSTGGKVAKGLMILPTWMIEFGLTGGLASLGSNAAKQAGEKLLKSYAKSKAGRTALSLAGWTGGAITRASLGLGARVAEKATERQVNVQLLGSEQEGWAKSFAKAWGDVVIEAGSETAGEAIMKAPVSLLMKSRLGQRFLVELHRAMGGNKPMGKFTRELLTKGGYSNIIGEMSEERLGTILRAITKVEDFGAGKDSTIRERLAAGLKQDAKNLGVEAIVLGVPMGGQVVLGQFGRGQPDALESFRRDLEEALKPEQARENVEGMKAINRLVPDMTMEQMQGTLKAMRDQLKVLQTGEQSDQKKKQAQELIAQIDALEQQMGQVGGIGALPEPVTVSERQRAATTPEEEKTVPTTTKEGVVQREAAQEPESVSEGEVEPTAGQKPVRFEAGKKLTPEEREEVLQGIGDTYVDMKAPKVEKGIDQRSGDPIVGYEYNPDYMVTSDITGRKIRHYLTLPDGRKAHPTELFPNITQAQVDKAVFESQARARQTEARRTELLGRTAPSLQEANLVAAKAGYKPGTDTSVYRKGDEYIRISQESDKKILEAEGFREIIRAGEKISPTRGTLEAAVERGETTQAIADRAEEFDEIIHKKNLNVRLKFNKGKRILDSNNPKHRQDIKDSLGLTDAQIDEDVKNGVTYEVAGRERGFTDSQTGQTGSEIEFWDGHEAEDVFEELVHAAQRQEGLTKTTTRQAREAQAKKLAKELTEKGEADLSKLADIPIEPPANGKIDDSTQLGSVFSIKRRKWEFAQQNSKAAGEVNRRLMRELNLHTILTGATGIETRELPVYKTGKLGTVPDPRSLYNDIYEKIKAGVYKRLMDRKVSPNTLADERGLQDEERKKYIEEIGWLRKSPLYLDPGTKTTSQLTDNAKTKIGVGFPVATCHPSAKCVECYASTGPMADPPAIRKHYRNLITIMSDPKGWAESINAELKKLPKAKVPFMRLLDVGDLTSTEMVKAFNHLAQIADRPLHIFSRHHEMLAKLKDGPNAPFMRMGSVDTQLFEVYGLKWLKENMRKRKIANAWLYTDPSEIPNMKKLFDAGELRLILAANVKAHKALPKEMQMAGCPCDAADRPSVGSCRLCALSQGGCYMAFSEWSTDREGNWYKLMDENAPSDAVPVTQWFDSGVMPQAYTNIALDITKKTRDAIVRNIRFFKSDDPRIHKDYINIPDFRWDNDNMKVFSEEEGREWADVYKQIIEQTKKGSFIIKGGEIQPAVVYSKGEMVTDPAKMKRIMAKAQEVRASAEPPAEIPQFSVKRRGLTMDEVRHVSRRTANALREAQAKGLKVGYKVGAASNVDAARKAMDKIMLKEEFKQQNRIDAANIVLTYIPKDKQGSYIYRILNAKSPKRLMRLNEGIQGYLDRADKKEAKDNFIRFVKRVRKDYRRGEEPFGKLPPRLGAILKKTLEQFDIAKLSEKKRGKLEARDEYIHRAVGGLVDAYKVMDTQTEIGVYDEMDPDATNILRMGQARIEELRRLHQTHVGDLNADQMRYIQAELEHLLKVNELKGESKQRRHFENLHKKLVDSRNEVREAKAKHPPLWRGALGAFRWINVEGQAQIRTLIGLVTGKENSATLELLLERIRRGKMEEHAHYKNFVMTFREKAKARGVTYKDIANLNEVVTVTLAGEKIQISRGDLLSIYAHTEAEGNLRDLLRTRGLNINTKIRVKGVIKKTIPYRIGKPTIGELRDIRDQIPEKHKELVEAYFETNFEAQSKAINKTSMEYQNYPLARKKRYFHVKRDMEQIAEGTKSDLSKSIDMLGRYLPKVGGGQRMDIRSFDLEVIEGMKSDAMYAGLLIPLEDARTLLADRAWRSKVKRAGAERALRELTTMFRRVQGLSTDQSVVDRVANTVLSRISKSLLGLRISGGLVQIASVTAAFETIEPKYFVGTDTPTPKKIKALMDKYPTLWMRWQAKQYDYATGLIAERSVFEGMLFDHVPISDKALAPYTIGDQAALYKIYRASQRKAKAETNLEGEALEKAAMDIFYQALDSQPQWDMLFRSPLTSSSNAFLRAMVVFMSARNAQYNVLLRAIDDGRKGRISSKDVSQRISGVVMANVFVNVARRSFKTLVAMGALGIISALGGDDEQNKRKAKQIILEDLSKLPKESVFNVLGLHALGSWVTGAAYAAEKRIKYRDTANYADIRTNNMITDVGLDFTELAAQYAVLTEQYLEPDPKKRKFRSGPREGKLKWVETSKEAADLTAQVFSNVLGLPWEGPKSDFIWPIQRAMRPPKKEND